MNPDKLTALDYALIAGAGLAGFVVVGAVGFGALWAAYQLEVRSMRRNRERATR